MKHARKLTSLLLALVMVFALAVTVAADETTGTTGTGRITVVNPIADKTYTAYKIFDVVYEVPTTTKHYSYTIKDGDGGSPWFSTVKTYADVTENGLTLTPVEGTNTYVVTFDEDKFSAPKFAETLNGAVNGKPGRPLAVADGKATVTDLDLGYYFVTSASGALCNLTTTDPDAEIYDKTDVPFEKTVDKPSADVGKDVTFTIKGKVPDYTGFDKYTYLITDTMTNGLTFNRDSLTVKVGETTVTDGCPVTYDPAIDSQTFTVSIPVKDNNYDIGAEIVVIYTATLNEKAIAVISNNEAKLTYSNDPTTDEAKGSRTDKKEVYTSKIVINKYETDNENKKLNGAKFVLYKEVTPEGTTEATKVYYKWDETAQKVEWVPNKDQATVKETGKDGNPGEASFEGLADGTYYLVETKAPAGYNQLDKPQKVEVHDGEHNAPVTTATQLSVTAKVANQAGTLLPSTGGMGTTIFYVLGFVLVVGAGVLLVTKKRMSQGEV